jgi:hypothetical protein
MIFGLFSDKKEELRKTIHHTLVRKALEASRYFIQTKQKKLDAILAQHQIDQHNQADSLTVLGRRCFDPFSDERDYMVISGGLDKYTIEKFEEDFDVKINELWEIEGHSFNIAGDTTVYMQPNSLKILSFPDFFIEKSITVVDETRQQDTQFEFKTTEFGSTLCAIGWEEEGFRKAEIDKLDYAVTEIELSDIVDVSYSEKRLALTSSKSSSKGEFSGKTNTTSFNLSSGNVGVSFGEGSFQGEIGMDGEQSGVQQEVITEATLQIFFADKLHPYELKLAPLEEWQRGHGGSYQDFLYALKHLNASEEILQENQENEKHAEKLKLLYNFLGRQKTKS